jgi:hypothetical protein
VRRLPAGPNLTGVALASAAATVALYLGGVACWEALAETYADADTSPIIAPEAYGNAHTLWALSQGMGKMANFTAGAFLIAAAAGLLTSGLGTRWIGLSGVLVGFFLVADGPLQIWGQSDWSDLVGAFAFIMFLAWIIAASIMLVVPLGRGVARNPRHQ